MAQYKVPQDVEADDKLIGPFSFRQFVYLLIAAGLIALAVGLFQLFPLLAIIPIPFAVFFLALALPLKKDQPMETYLAAILNFHLKPRTKKWMSGQRDSTILITAPKIVEDVRTRDISGEEATHRLSFLADIVDTEGYAIKGAGASPMREDLVAEANATPDMFETYQSQVINRVIDQDKMSRHQSAVDEMRNAIERNNASFTNLDEPTAGGGERVILPAGAANTANTAASTVPAQNVQNMQNSETEMEAVVSTGPQPILDMATVRNYANLRTMGTTQEAEGLRANAILKPDVDIENSDVVVRPELDFNRTEKPEEPEPKKAEEPAEKPENSEKAPTKPVNNSIMELANNTEFSVATIAKEANRINNKGKGEIFVSLH